MIWLSFVWFTLLYGAGFYFSPNKDLCSPLRLVSLKYAFFNLPFIFFTALYPETFLRGILSVTHTDVYTAFLKYTLLQTLAYLCLIAGILFFSKQQKENIAAENINISKLVMYTVVAVLFALAAYGVFLYRIGGLGYLLTHLKDRVSLQGGQYILILLELLPLVILLLLLLKRTQNKKSTVPVVVALLVFGLLYVSFGGRKPAMILVAVFLAGWHYYIRGVRFNAKTIKYALAGTAIFACFLLVVPVLRGDALDHGTADNKLKVGARNFVYNLSYTYIDIFAANYYNAGNAWYMDGYFEPVKAFNYKGDKGCLPQVDQGVYFKNIYLKQKDFRPPLARNEVSSTSWPTENFGFAYANFLIAGVVVFFLLQGMVFSVVYRYLIKNLYNPVLLLVYVQVILQFNFSSLRIAFFLKTLPLYCICWFVFNKFVAPKNRQHSLREA
jgi:oligosaccharide repeat unit polymerase